MNDRHPVRRALVSVSDKRGLEVLASCFRELEIELISTGGTYAWFRDWGLPAIKVSEHTGSPEILDGRVKTLHPTIHGGILSRATAEDAAVLAQSNITPIDLVVVNLYPFQATVAKPGCSFEDAVENIDIGGPTMIRAAAKNCARVTVVVDPSDYEDLVAELRAHGGISDSQRRRLAGKAFTHTAEYDSAIATYWRTATGEGADTPPPSLLLAAQRVSVLRYGENPQQAAALYRVGPAEHAAGITGARQIQGKELSYNNLLDADVAWGLVQDLAPLGPAVSVIKHLSPCGAAVGHATDSLAAVFVRARDADAESAFGGIVALSRTLDAATATALAETFFEVIIAPKVDEDAALILASKKNLRVLQVADRSADRVPPDGDWELRSVVGGVLLQRRDELRVSVENAKLVTRRPLDVQLHLDLEVAQRIAKHVRSNAIVLVRDGRSVGIGGGQTSRVEAVRQAVARAGALAEGACVASDAFFPFRDSIDALAQVGVAAIIQPGGAMRDAEVIEAADAHDLAMVLTGERHFRH